jgi:hypothetical protein
VPPSKIPAKTRAAAIADLMDGAQPAVVAERYGIEAGKVRMWKTRYVAPNVAESTPPAFVYRPTVLAQQIAIGDLIMDNLRAKLIATQKIAEYATTPSWFDKQTAADVATLFEAIDRSAVGILDRLAQRRSGADRQSDELAQPGPPEATAADR